jgi:hypothetical protein
METDIISSRRQGKNKNRGQGVSPSKYVSWARETGFESGIGPSWIHELEKKLKCLPMLLLMITLVTHSFSFWRAMIKYLSTFGSWL